MAESDNSIVRAFRDLPEDTNSVSRTQVRLLVTTSVSSPRRPYASPSLRRNRPHVLPLAIYLIFN